MRARGRSAYVPQSVKKALGQNRPHSSRPRTTAMGRSISEEVNELWAESRVLFLETAHGKPLTVLIEENSERWLLYLDEESAQRVREVLGGEWGRPRINVDHETRAAYESTYGHLLDKLVPSLTGLEPSVVRELGGIQFIDAGTRKVRYTPVLDGDGGSGGLER